MRKPKLRARSEIIESLVATHWFLDVMAGAGPASTTCNAGIKKDVNGRPAPHERYCKIERGARLAVPFVMAAIGGRHPRLAVPVSAEIVDGAPSHAMTL